MHDFLSYLMQLFARSLSLALPAALMCAALISAAWLLCKKRGRPFPWMRAAALLLFVIWAAVAVYATILRSEPALAAQWNLHLFRAWREAWNRFTLQIWLNVLLNIAFFVPFGLLLPLLGRVFRRWYAALSAAFFSSLAIELIQLFTMRGMCDVDDLFTNTLGAMLGWSLTMLVLTLRARPAVWKKRLAAYCAVPLALSLALIGIAVVYALRPYGNLREASVETADLKNVEWTLAFSPSEEPRSAQVYQTQTLDKARAEQYAAYFAAARGIEFPDAYYYDDLIVFANHSSGDFLNLTLHDGSWDYTLGDTVTPRFDCAADTISEAALRDALDSIALTLPAHMTYDLSVEENGFAYARFTADLLPENGTFLNGTLTCCLREQNGVTTLTRIESDLTTLTPVREEAILTPAEAVELLKRGKSFEGAALEAFGARRITVRECVLTLCSDTKGFYQPVYRFTLKPTDLPHFDGIFTDYVPALR